MLLALHFRYLESSVQTKIWLKTKRNLLVISCSSSTNLSLVRMHEFVAREISLLRSQNPSVWVSTSSMRAVQADIEDPQESRDRKPWRNSPGYWKQSWVQGRTLKSLAPRAGLTHQALGHLFGFGPSAFVLSNLLTAVENSICPPSDNTAQGLPA
jgi:hypothetical protein